MLQPSGTQTGCLLSAGVSPLRCPGRHFQRPRGLPTSRQGAEPAMPMPWPHQPAGAVQRRRLPPCMASSLRTAEPANSRIGFLGLGIMGWPMALNLLKAGYSLTVWNRTMERCDDLAAGGAAVALTPAEVVAQSDITIAMLADPKASLVVALGPDGAASAMAEGKAYVDVSTVDSATSRRIAAAVHAAGGRFLEAPVSGSKGPAEQGQLVFLTAGDRDAFEASRPLLEVMGKASLYLGDTGAGAHMKLVVNQVMGTMMAAFAEGMVLAEGAGLQKEDVVEVLGLGAMACPMFKLKGPSMVKRSYPTAFPLKHQQKDLRLALELAEQLGRRLPLALAANELFAEAQAQGLGDEDFAAVQEVLLK